MSIIDSLGKGFQTVNRYWWLLLIPVLLDVFLWVGPQASVQAIRQESLEKLGAEQGKDDVEEADGWLGMLYASLKEAPSNYINSGYYILEPEVFNLIKDKEKAMTEYDVFPKLAKLRKLYGFKTEGLWFDTGTQERYEEVKRKWKS